ncbi:MAG: PfkB family carbohydrate kinase [candidate division FCPU426 bacterium]
MPLFKILVPGSVLLDIYPASPEAGEKRYLGGAEFNFAYHVHCLQAGGVDFAARIGADEPGRFIRAELDRRGFPSRLLQVDPVRRTKTVIVRRDENNQPRYDIPTNVASEFLDFPPLPPRTLAEYDLLYFGTTLQHGPHSRSTLRRLLAECPAPKFCDLNLRPGKFTRETVEYCLRTCELLKLNHEELDQVSEDFGLAGSQEARLAALAGGFSIGAVCLTLAEKGSYWWQDGRLTEHRLSAPPAVDPVGAGDAFSACLALGWLSGWDAPRLLEAASSLAAAVCGQPGALPETADFYLPFRALFQV